jgi:hypothetical protein
MRTAWKKDETKRHETGKEKEQSIMRSFKIKWLLLTATKEHFKHRHLTTQSIEDEKTRGTPLRQPLHKQRGQLVEERKD